MKLCDLECAALTGVPPLPPVSLPLTLYTAPDNGHGYSTSSDVYSTGMLLCEVFTRCLLGRYQRVFAEHEQDEPSILVKVTRGLRPRIPDNCPPPLSALLAACASPLARSGVLSQCYKVGMQIRLNAHLHLQRSNNSRRCLTSSTDSEY